MGATEYTLTRSNRKTCAIYVRHGAVEVKAPLKMPKADIDRFVMSKAGWIAKNLVQSQENSEQRKLFKLQYGDKLLYRGTEYPITAKPGNEVGFDNEVFFMPPNFSPEEIKRACIQIYRMLAIRDLSKKALDFSNRMGVMPSNVKINGAKTR